MAGASSDINKASRLVSLTRSLATALIFDTDWSTDVDDVEAFGLLADAQGKGAANLLAVTMSCANEAAAPSVRGLLNWLGLPAVPVGAYQGANVSPGMDSTSTYTVGLRDTFGAVGETRAAYPDAVTTLRTALAASAGNVVVLCVGQPLNLGQLLASPADGISSLNGVDLVAAKVARFVVMGGNFPSGSEYNFRASPAQAASFFATCPVPVECIGFEASGDSLSGPNPLADGATNPFKRAFELYRTDKREAPDPIAALWALYGAQDGYFSLGPPGTNVVNASTGGNAWTAGASGKHRYITRLRPQAEVGARLDTLFAGVTPDALSTPTHDIDFVASTYLGVLDRTGPKAVEFTDLFTFTRASVGWAKNGAGVWVQYAANVPRMDDLGLLLEGARTNYFLSSTAPATQTINLPAGNYSIWIEGTGSVALSGTATGTVTASGGLTRNVAAGNLTLTISGSVTFVQVENGQRPTSRIVTGASAVTRAADVMKPKGMLRRAIQSSRQGTVWTEQSGIILTAQEAYPRIIGNAASVNRFLLSVESSPTKVSSFDASNVITADFIGTTWAATTRTLLAWDTAGRLLAVKGRSPVTTANAIAAEIEDPIIGDGFGGHPMNGRLRRLVRHPVRVDAITAQGIVG